MDPITRARQELRQLAHEWLERSRNDLPDLRRGNEWYADTLLAYHDGSRYTYRVCAQQLIATFLRSVALETEKYNDATDNDRVPF